MKNPYLKNVLNLILINACIIGIVGLLNGWEPSSVGWTIVYFSKWIAMLFIPYLLLLIKKIETNKSLCRLLIFLPAIIISIIVLKNYYQLFTGQIVRGGFSGGRFFHPSDLKLILTGTVIIASYLQFKAYKAISKKN